MREVGWDINSEGKEKNRWGEGSVAEVGAIVRKDFGAGQPREWEPDLTYVYRANVSASVLKASCLWLLISVYWDISVQSDPDKGYGKRVGFEGCLESPRCRHSGELRTLKSPKRTLWEVLVNSSGIISYGTLRHVFWNMGWRGFQGLQAIGKQTPETVLGD